MGQLSIILTTALVLAGAPFLSLLDPLLSGLTSVIALAAAASLIAGRASPRTLIYGALAALALTLLWPVAPVLAGAATFALLHMGRAVRARGGRGSTAIQLALAATSGGIATLVVILHLGAGWQLLTVAVTVAALVASSPLLFPVDDSLTAALRDLARRSSGVLRWRLDRAVVLRRKLMAQAETLAAGDLAKLNRAFDSLLRVSHARLLAGGDSADKLDASLADHLSALERGLSALDRRTAVRTDLDSRGAEELQREAEEIESEVEALAEVTASPIAVENRR